jgi:methylated-DNA-protein-cysteine methyltransferase-like protein
MLTGKHFFETPQTMQQRLEEEGIRVVEDIIQDFQQHFWDPNQELSL